MTMTANERIMDLERKIEEHYDELSQLRASTAPAPWKDYEFTAADGSSVTLSDLFGTKNRLILVHNMGRQCPYCTVWADGFSDSYHRLTDHMAFVVTSKESIEDQKKNIAERNWQFPMVSSRGNGILEDLGFLDEDQIIPGLASFSKNERGELFYHGKRAFGSGDQFGMLWHLLDLTDTWHPDAYAPPDNKQ